ncbi:MAG: pentapeptide repeat-containing protein, partial [Candidatus Latescibacteria bacterium]|nr:pentapeptide repeat-containing protein [Candidatus Latescibacterota bacterium]
MQQENSSQKISRELRWLFEQNDWLTLEYVTSCSDVPQSTVHRAKEGNVRLQRRIALKLAEFIDDETKGKVSVNYLLNANGRSAEVSRKGKNCEHTDQDYSGLNLSFSDHSQSIFTRCDFSRANLTRAIFREAKFLDCTFDHAQMLGADFSRTTVEDCTFFRADGSMSNWTDAYITESNFRDFIHTGINFTR